MDMVYAHAYYILPIQMKNSLMPDVKANGSILHEIQSNSLKKL